MRHPYCPNCIEEYLAAKFPVEPMFVNVEVMLVPATTSTQTTGSGGALGAAGPAY